MALADSLDLLWRFLVDPLTPLIGRRINAANLGSSAVFWGILLRWSSLGHGWHQFQILPRLFFFFVCYSFAISKPLNGDYLKILVNGTGFGIVWDSSAMSKRSIDEGFAWGWGSRILQRFFLSSFSRWLIMSVWIHFGILLGFFWGSSNIFDQLVATEQSLNSSQVGDWSVTANQVNWHD